MIHQFLTSDNFWISLFRDVLYAFALVSVLAIALYAYAGVWPPLVSVEGTSMYPNMQNGDLIVVQGLNKMDIVTNEIGKQNGYKMFGDYGDVIVYRPFGRSDVTPVIHRAMYWTNASEVMWDGGVQAPAEGYITQGDNNFLYDQCSGICPNTPVKDEWILGVAKYRIPYLGYIRGLLGFIG
ncbi:S26 family signal peptidase [Methanooceanicella nereidis]|uniref:S26 family signal peptidase n=1 Tax=Methanooceanicella nereidis TaxID=2052831 RepID=UPI001E5EFC79|nr:S26 family signal peptidase [Methanocella sp. CWC-04]